MSSMRLLSQLLKPSHTQCLVEWQESGSPVSVVASKQVADGDTVKFGDLCTVNVREGSKTVGYTAKILGMGKSEQRIFVYIILA